MCPACLQAVESWVDVIPGEVLSDGVDVAMVVPPPSQFVVEPYVTTEPVQVGCQDKIPRALQASRAACLRAGER